MDDIAAMSLALLQAREAAAVGEVPVGAVVVRHGEIISTGRNAPIGQHDPCAHAEILALRAAGTVLSNYRLDDCELFVTLEPCAMCAGAMLHARLKRVVFGAFDPKTGAGGSVLNLFGNTQLNHRTQVTAGVLASECTAVLQDFFRKQRQDRSSNTWPLREDALRTPFYCFDALPELPGETRLFSDLPTLAGLRLHVTDAGPRDSTKVRLCLHGAKSWSLVWRHEMCDRVARGERVLAVDLIGFGRSDKLKKASAYATDLHLQVLSELLEQLNLSHVLVLEPAGDCIPGKFPTETLGEALANLLPKRVDACESVMIDALSPQAANAPYPDSGHRAAQRAVAFKDSQ